jgi:hypothetical protein
MRAPLIATLVAAASLLAASAQAHTAKPPQHVKAPQHVKVAIYKVFGPRIAPQALRVAWCESRFQTTARNGQYLGLFQMGSHERRTFGHGATALAQARAAYRYYRYSLRHNGDGWRPWSCRWAAE